MNNQHFTQKPIVETISLIMIATPVNQYHPAIHPFPNTIVMQNTSRDASETIKERKTEN